MRLAIAAGAALAPRKLFFGDKAYRLFLLRSMLAPGVAYRWSKFIRAFHDSVGAAEAPSRVLIKPLRSYVRRGLSARQRLELMLNHYTLAQSFFSRDVVRALCNGQRIPLARIAGRKATTFVVSLTASVTASLQREGEIAVVIQREGRGEMLSRLSFSVAQIDGERAVVIGALQGPHADGRREVVDATRDLHGLRPKDATLLAARALARAFGIRAVHAVADANHVLRGRADVAKLARYDEYWLERGAAAGGPFGYRFAPLATAGEALSARAAAKSTIVDGVEAFASAQSEPLAAESPRKGYALAA